MCYKKELLKAVISLYCQNVTFYSFFNTLLTIFRASEKIMFNQVKFYSIMLLLFITLGAFVLGGSLMLTTNMSGKRR